VRVDHVQHHVDAHAVSCEIQFFPFLVEDLS
jgi:hypothetical protein